METFYLERPTLERKQEALDYIKEFQEYNSKIHGVGGLHHYLEDYEAWLEKLKEDSTRISNNEKVKSITYFLIRKNDNKIIGMSNIRLELTDKLKHIGGHIGYSIRPTERKKGYNKINLYLALKVFQKHNISKILLDADKENPASWKTMESLGGVNIKEFYDEEEKCIVKKYEIDVNLSLNKYKPEYDEKIFQGKIIFIDLDGTLCNDDKSISKENYEALEKASQDNIIVLCTGRRLAKILPITNGYNFCSYIIALNGAQVYDLNNKIILKEDSISHEQVKEIYNLTSDNCVITMCSGVIRYTNEVKYDEDILIDQNIINNLENINIPQIVLIGEYSSLIKHKEALNNKVNITNLSRDLLYEDSNIKVVASFIDISSDSASKGSGVKYLLNYLDISKDNAIAIGDGINDLPMFNEVKEKVAMENGDEFLKKEATFITKSNNNSGVAYFLNNNLQ